MNNIQSIADLIGVIREERAKSSKALWFRGQCNHSWGLLPGLLRKENKMSESSLLARFKQSAAMLVSAKPSNDFDWVFLMQHYGVPTRLLDWSENPLVALYFAVSDDTGKNNEEDAALWLLRPSELNKHAHINDKHEGDYIPSFDDAEVSGYSTERVRHDSRFQLFPIATIATRNNSRIQAQSGTFTIHHNNKVPIEQVGDGNQCVKVIIPKTSKGLIQEELAMIGMTRFSLFPEMDSIGRMLKESI